MTTDRAVSPLARLSKLRAMSAKEVIHRVRYAAAIRTERRQHAVGNLAPPDRLRAAIDARFASPQWEQQLIASRLTQTTRFYSSVGHADAMRALFTTAYAQQTHATLAEAANARRHRFE